MAVATISRRSQRVGSTTALVASSFSRDTVSPRGVVRPACVWHETVIDQASPDTLPVLAGDDFEIGPGGQEPSGQFHKEGGAAMYIGGGLVLLVLIVLLLVILL